MIRVFIVDDHPLVQEGIKSLLTNEKDIEVCGYAMNAQSCIGYFVNHKADVILMDINLPDKNGIDLCREIKQAHPEVMVLGLSTFNQGSYVTKMMENGASGYVLKNADKSEMIEAIHEVSKGKTYLSFEVALSLRKTDNELPLITRREKEILLLMMEGDNYHAIAEKCFLSYDTVRTHVRSIYKKLYVASVNQAIVKAFKQRLI